MTMQTTTQNDRQITRVIQGLPATDGAGVELDRLISQPRLTMLDPFLLLDAFHSNNPEDYIAGFPEHPHRGFETVTYLLAGNMRHKDSAGHEGVIRSGGVQWMTAGRGVSHSEMPEQEDGLLQGFQLWLNLPASHKMTVPQYQEYSADEIPVETRDNGIRIHVIAGTTELNTIGPVKQPLTEPIYYDVTIPPNQVFTETLPSEHAAFINMIDGDIQPQDINSGISTIQQKDLAVLSDGDTITLKSGSNGARFLLIAGKPLKEPVARRGPFVMNTKAEIDQAFQEYANGQF